MENYVPMSAADALGFGVGSAETFVLILTAEFSVVFAYLAAYYFFLRMTRGALRLYAFAAVTLMVLFFWSMLLVQLSLINSFYEHRQASIKAGTMFEASAFVASHFSTVLSIFTWAVNLIHMAALLGLFYLTFFFDWSKPEGAK